jgi:hypothetical protein
MKTIKECLEELDKLKFSLEYRVNTSKWNLVIFNEKLEIIDELENDYLADLLFLFFKEEINYKWENEFYNLNPLLQLFYSNCLDNNEFNFYSIDIFYEKENRTFSENNKINNLKDLEYKLLNMSDIIENFRENCNEWLYEEKYPYEARGLSISDFIDIKRFNKEI